MYLQLYLHYYMYNNVNTYKHIFTTGEEPVIIND